jgi:YidC/Oxa1 family membrane protein insertase
MQRGGETGASTFNDSQLGKMMIYGLPIVSTIVTGFWPSFLQLYFLASSVFAVIQTHFIISPRFRKWAGIAPLPTRVPGGGAGLVESGAQKRLRMIADKEAAKGSKSTQNVSSIDRAVDSLKTFTSRLRKELRGHLENFSGTSSKNPDGSLKPEPKKTQKEREKADSYESKRREEEEWVRRERNLRLKEQYQYQKPASKPKLPK